MALHLVCKKCGKLTTRKNQVCAKCVEELKNAQIKEAQKDLQKKANIAKDLLSAINETPDGSFRMR